MYKYYRYDRTDQRRINNLDWVVVISVKRKYFNKILLYLTD